MGAHPLAALVRYYVSIFWLGGKVFLLFLVVIRVERGFVWGGGIVHGIFNSLFST